MYGQSAIIQWLLNGGRLTDGQLQQGIRLLGNDGRDLVSVMLHHQLMTTDDLQAACHQLYQLEYVDLATQVIDESLFRLLSVSMMLQYQVIPIRVADGKLYLAVATPLLSTVQDDLALLIGRNIVYQLSAAETIENQLFAWLNSDMEGEQSDEIALRQVYSLSINSEDHLTKIVINSCLTRALDQKASDIHFEPDDQGMSIKFRVDGYLVPIWRLAKKMHPMLINLLKVMANLDIAEKRLPQDGHIRVRYEQREVDLRLSTLPLVFGEKIVLRILDNQQQLTNLEELGFGEHNNQCIRDLIQKPYGLILITGPTGSGKTTTLYSILESLKGRGKNIITIEDPVEYEMKGLNQLQVNHKIGLTFAQGLKAILRQDPDVIMIGEIRDQETAEIAIRASNTGHLVLASLHTNDAVSAIVRLMDMGIAPYLIAQCLLGVIAQRLVRKNCLHCQVPTIWANPLDNGQQLAGFKGIGCPQCHNLGYHGRMALQEMIMIGRRERALIMEDQGQDHLKAHIQAQGLLSLYDDGHDKVSQGLTTLDEILLTVLIE